MLKLAVIFEGSPFDRKGLFNAVHNRVKGLIASGRCKVDVFCIHSRDNAFTRRVRHTPDAPFVDHVDVDEVRYNLLWYRFSILDHVTVEKLHRRPLLFRRFIARNVKQLEGYDAVISHSFAGGLFAYEAHEYELSKKHLTKDGDFLIYKSRLSNDDISDFKKKYKKADFDIISYNLPLNENFDRNLIILKS